MENPIYSNCGGTSSADGYVDASYSNLTSAERKANRDAKKDAKNIPKQTQSTVTTKRKITLEGSGDKINKGLAQGATAASTIGSISDSVRGIFGKGKTPVQSDTVDTTTTSEEGMSTTTKVMIGVGVAVVLGGIIYMVTRKK